MLLVIKNSKKVENCKSKTKCAVFAIYVNSIDSELIDNFKKAMKHYELKSCLSNRFLRGLGSLSYGDYVLFGTGKKYDYEILSNEPTCKLYSLENESNKVSNKLYSYYRKNCKPAKKTVVECECKIVRKPVRRVITNVLPVRIHDNFVKMGYDIFRIKENYCTGQRSVKVNGCKRLIKRDHCGNEYLA